MRKLSIKKLKKIHTLLTYYDNVNKNIIFNREYLLEYCFESDIQNYLKTVLGRFDDKDFYNIFNSLNLKIDINEVKTERDKKLIKPCIKYADVDTFSKNYYKKS